MRPFVPLLTLALALAGCAADASGGTTTVATSPPPAEVTTGAPDATGPLPPYTGIAAQVVATGFSTPVWATTPPGDDRVFVVEQTGTIREIVDGAPAETPYLDVTRFITTEGLEQGLLGLAFHPDFAGNGRAFVSFTNVDGDTRIMEYLEDPSDPSLLDPGSGRLVLAVDQPHQYHNGGMVRFGPDGMLWVALGDGGGIGDSFGNGQDPHTVLGTMVRIDVDSATPYAVPEDNPFASGADGAPEVYVYGLRNPWRFSFADGHLFVADVGQEGWEEINVVDLASGGGENFGWPVMEGIDCYFKDHPDDAPLPDCDREGLVEPDLVVPHRRSCAIIGGPVYKGEAIPELAGHYVYGDYCVGWVRSARWVGDEFDDAADWSEDLGELGQITSFAEDGDGELLVLTAAGTIYRIVRR